MKRLVNTAKAFVGIPGKKEKVEGFVELITHKGFEGWVIHNESKPLNLTIRFRNETCSLNPQWHQRDDVMAARGSRYSDAGFYASWPDSVKMAIELEEITADDIKVFANKTELKITAPLPMELKQPDLRKEDMEVINAIDQEKSLRVPLDPITAINNTVGVESGFIDSFDKFLIRGHIIQNEDEYKAPVIEVSVNGLSQDWQVLWQHDRQEGQGENIEDKVVHYFEIEVPGYTWDIDAKNEITQLAIKLKIEGFNEPLQLNVTRALALKWLHDISLLEEHSKTQYYGLIAIEHLKFSKIIKELDPRTSAFYRNFAEKMQLGDYLSDGNNLEFSSALPPEPIIDFETEVLWTSLKNLNKELINHPGKVYESLNKLIVEKKLVGNVKKNLIQSAIPSLIKSNELFKLKQTIDFREFYALDHSDNAWMVSLSIAPLIADKQIGRATDALWRLAKMADDGWLNTECIYFAVQHVQNLREIGEVGYEEAEKLRYAVLAILDAFKGEWFSRLHDEMLQQAVILMLEKQHLMSDYLRLDVIKAAIRLYGLSPDFWKKVERADLGVLNDSLYIRAKKSWSRIKNALTDRSTDLKDFSSLERAFRFFESNGNPEAISTRRELISSLLKDPTIEKKDLYEFINESISGDPLEAVRYAAHPMLDDDIASMLVEEYRTEISESLRSTTERASSVSYKAQIYAANEIKSGNFNPLSYMPLHNWHAMFLSVDMLTSAMVKYPSGIEDNILLLDQYVRNVINKSHAGYWLPTPVCAALANIDSIAVNNVKLKAWIESIKILISKKFGDYHDCIFDINPEQKSAESLVSPGWPQDTLVVIYSCRAYLDTRIAAIREGWLKDLQARDIPYVILVGDGDDTLTGDVLALDVSDTYEDLPYKSLKLFDWVYNNTHAQYVLKIDDDCYLDVDKYFDCLAYRKHHYYGRVIHRPVGGMDRAWHHAKSKTIRAKKTLDKSPEPSLYADGGGGYTLSRIAMHALLRAASTIRGERLIKNSFMEDKLIGDLLSIGGIEPNNEDYECYQRRRTFGAATPVGMFENSFFASGMTATQVVHLDSEADQKKAHDINKTQHIWPKKIWPTCWPVSIRENSNQLELLSDLEKTRTLLNEEFFVVATMRNEMIMLPHFLEHYRGLGVKAFIISDNCSDDGTRELLLSQDDVVLYSADTGYKHSHYGVAWQQAILANHCVGKWALIADADELLIFPDYENTSLIEYVRSIESEGADCIRTDMVDMYPEGDLNDADFTAFQPFDVAAWHDKAPLIPWHLGSGYFSNRISSLSALRHRIDQNAEPNAFTSQKYALVKYQPWQRMSQGIHDIANVDCVENETWFAHFKYHAGFKNKILEEIRRKQHYDGAKEYRRYQEMLAESSGNFYSSERSVEFDGKGDS